MLGGTGSDASSESGDTGGDSSIASSSESPSSFPSSWSSSDDPYEAARANAADLRREGAVGFAGLVDLGRGGLNVGGLCLGAGLEVVGAIAEFQIVPPWREWSFKLYKISRLELWLRCWPFGDLCKPR